jgi:outer membrane protein assembly factor BamE (lipoprotein component of BamABCDE complex)
MLMLLRCCILLVAASALLASTGCATHDRRDTSYDPKINQGQSLFDQMPNWERRCLHKGVNRC